MITGEVLEHEGYLYSGPCELACGASQQQKDIEKAQSDFYNQMTSEYGTVFGEDQGILKTLTAAFEPILAAGINQQGFSQAELNNLNSEAVTGSGQAFNSASKQLAAVQGAQGGGTAYIPTGAKMQQQAELATSAAQNVSNEEANITASNYATGRENYMAAASALGGVANEMNPTALAQAANQGGAAASTTANEITQANNSWMGLVGAGLGAAGSIFAGKG